MRFLVIAMAVFMLSLPSAAQTQAAPVNVSVFYPLTFKTVNEESTYILKRVKLLNDYWAHGIASANRLPTGTDAEKVKTRASILSRLNEDVMVQWFEVWPQMQQARTDIVASLKFTPDEVKQDGIAFTAVLDSAQKRPSFDDLLAGLADEHRFSVALDYFSKLDQQLGKKAIHD